MLFAEQCCPVCTPYYAQYFYLSRSWKTVTQTSSIWAPAYCEDKREEYELFCYHLTTDVFFLDHPLCETGCDTKLQRNMVGGEADREGKGTGRII